jgi:hypothetical protein
MFERHPHAMAFRAFLAAACLAIIAGCIPQPSAVSAGPVNLTAVAGDAVVTLAWTSGNGVTAYHVKRSTTFGGPFVLLASPATNDYVDSTVINGTTYYYVVSQVDGAGESANSAQATAKPTIPDSPPPVPGRPVATAGTGQVGLTWDPSSTARSYRVKRSTTSGGPYTQIANPTATSYTDTAVVVGTTYYYVVSAVNSAGESANSAQVLAVPSNPPPTTFGTWTNVTPAGVDLVSSLCSNFGTQSVQRDPANPSHLYAQFHCQGIWKSTDYGATWTGPINTGTNGTLAGQCSGGISIAPGSAASVPTIYQACIRGNAIGFWRSVNGGVNWTQHNVAPGGARQDYYPPVVDPNDQNHLLMTGHEFDSLVESVDGGQNWTSVPLNPGMLQINRSASVFFINTGNAVSTRGTWLWVGGDFGGTSGTWRTTNSGTTWVRVEKNEQVGSTQIYQPDNNGVVYMAGANSDLGAGVLRSTNYGQTWSRVGNSGVFSVVFGTTSNVYAMFGFPIGPGGSLGPSFTVAAQPGTGTWVSPPTAAGLTQGPAQIATVNNGTSNIFVGAMWNVGLWRYVEP